MGDPTVGGGHYAWCKRTRELLVEKSDFATTINGQCRIHGIGNRQQIVRRPGLTTIRGTTDMQGIVSSANPVGPGDVDGRALPCSWINGNAQMAANALLPNRWFVQKGNQAVLRHTPSRKIIVGILQCGEGIRTRAPIVIAHDDDVIVEIAGGGTAHHVEERPIDSAIRVNRWPD